MTQSFFHILYNKRLHFLEALCFVVHFHFLEAGLGFFDFCFLASIFSKVAFFSSPAFFAFCFFFLFFLSGNLYLPLAPWPFVRMISPLSTAFLRNLLIELFRNFDSGGVLKFFAIYFFTAGAGKNLFSLPVLLSLSGPLFLWAGGADSVFWSLLSPPLR